MTDTDHMVARLREAKRLGAQHPGIGKAVLADGARERHVPGSSWDRRAPRVA
ncbi:hypothetical protein [Streptomyces fagopyri]|uniref:hypothetical protein n=1 Tax=Streptomyces fagopyri TaxID=2662397 RepID=UPI0033ECABB1